MDTHAAELMVEFQNLMTRAEATIWLGADVV